MSKLEIVTYPHPALRYESKPITRIDDSLRAIVREMFDLMYEARGIGLAANQVAIPFRFFVLNLTADPNQPDQERVYINPEITKRHGMIEEDEGCLSFPGLYGKVKRARKIKVKAYTLEGRLLEEELDELHGRAVQHETDHLLGKLYIDHFAPETRKSLDPGITKIETHFRTGQSAGLIPSDDLLKRRLDEMASSGDLRLFNGPSDTSPLG